MLKISKRHFFPKTLPAVCFSTAERNHYLFEGINSSIYHGTSLPYTVKEVEMKLSFLPHYLPHSWKIWNRFKSSYSFSPNHPTLHLLFHCTWSSNSFSSFSPTLFEEIGNVMSEKTPVLIFFRQNWFFNGFRVRIKGRGCVGAGDKRLQLLSNNHPLPGLQIKFPINRNWFRYGILYQSKLYFNL